MLKKVKIPKIRGEKIVMLIIIIFTAYLLSCNTTEPPINGKEITLKLEDASCTEAWIKLSIDNSQLPIAVTLLQDGKARKTMDLETKDSLLYIDSLLPNTSYMFQSTILSSSHSSNELNVATMDTTSHDFTFTTYTFGGQAGTCTLYDVAIIDENNIWAVGEIYLLDSLEQPDPHAYNAVHWDGNQWEIKRLKYYGSCSAVEYPPLKAIWAFSNNDMVITNGGSIGWFNGNTVTLDCGVNPLLTGSINKIWGTDSRDLYVVGNNGNIAHYQNGQWSKIESGTTTIINDIWGIINNQDKTILYCPVSSFFVPGDKKILKITADKVDSVSWNRDIRLYSGWTSDENFLYVCGEGAYVNKFGNWSRINLPEVGMNSVRGNDINDISIAGDFGFVAHFNGVNWKTLSSFNDKGYSEVAVKGNIIAICGNYNGLGLIEIGKRN